MPLRSLNLEITVPSYFTCPISLHLMLDPVSLSTGVTYDRSSIETWLDNGNNTCPVTRQVLHNQDLIPNHALRRLIQEWCVLNRSNGVERIPTPLPPAEPFAVRSILHKIASDSIHRLDSLKSLKRLAKASDRNRKCLKEENAVSILIDLVSCDIAQVSQEALDCLILLPLEAEHRRTLLASKLDTISCILNRAASIETRANAAKLLEALALEKCAVHKIGLTKGILEGLVALLKECLCPIAIKAGLKTLQALSLAPRIRLKLVEMEVIPIVVDVLPGANRSRTEQIMALLSSLSYCAEGRAAITGHALAIPAIARSMLGISEITTEHAVEILWSISHHSADDNIFHEFLSFGVFQKLLVAVQMDNNIQLKQRATDLLRLMREICGEASCSPKSSLYISL